MADATRLVDTADQGGLWIQGTLATARPIGTIVRNTADGLLYVSTNAVVATYTQLTGTSPIKSQTAYVDPSAPGAVDDSTLTTPFVTILGALNAILILIGLAAFAALGLFVKSRYDVQMGAFTKERTYREPKPSPPISQKPAKRPAPRAVPKTPKPPPTPLPEAIPAPKEALDYGPEMRKLNNLINLGSKDADAFYNRGWLYAHKEDLQMAEKDYTKAIEIHKQHAGAYYNRGLAYVKMKKYPQAVADFTQVIKLNPRALDAYCNRGNANFQLGKMDLALVDYDAALRIKPNDGDLYYNRAIVYLAKGQNSKADADFKKAANLGHSEAIRYLGMAPAKPTSSTSRPMTSHTGWNMDLKSVKIPLTSASGKIHGKDFVVEDTKVENGVLTLRQGKDFFPDRAVTIFLFLKKGDKLEGKMYNISRDHGFGAPHIHMAWKEGGKGVPETKIFTKEYAMRLQFKEKQNKLLPGNIFLSLPDDSKSFVAGTFTAKVK